MIGTILGSPSQKVRGAACHQLKRLSRIKASRSSRRALDLDSAEHSSEHAKKPNEDAKFLLTKLILKAPVPVSLFSESR